MEVNHFGTFDMYAGNGSIIQSRRFAGCSMSLRESHARSIAYLPVGAMKILGITEKRLLTVLSFINEMGYGKVNLWGIEKKKTTYGGQITTKSDYYIVEMINSQNLASYVSFLFLRPLYSTLNKMFIDCLLEIEESGEFKDYKWEARLALATYIKRPCTFDGVQRIHNGYYGLISNQDVLMRESFNKTLSNSSNNVNYHFSSGKTVDPQLRSKISELFNQKEYKQVQELFYNKVWKIT